jgi:drug/metabolite transporter superfamily protein YnfA
LGSSRTTPAIPGAIREAILTTLIREFWLFLRQNKKLWLLPIVAVMLLLGALLVFAQGSALAPFIYTLF